MVARSHESLHPDSPHDDDLALPIDGARWAVERLLERGLELDSALRDPDGGWVPCSIRELLEDGAVASIGQRMSCGGLLTTVHVWDRGGLRGAFWLAHAPGACETPFFRVVLLQALLRLEHP